MKAPLSFDDELAQISSVEKPRLLLHCCCAPCASYVLEYLSQFFIITCLYYNPNIQPRKEYDKREAELSKLLIQAEYANRFDVLACDYDAASFEAVALPFWSEPEGGRRCRECFNLRLGETAKRAKDGGFGYFATTLSVSPQKDAELLNEIGARLAEEYGVKYLHSDFKKRDGYKNSIDLSKRYGLYRQSYCGCLSSVRNS